MQKKGRNRKENIVLQLGLRDSTHEYAMKQQNPTLLIKSKYLTHSPHSGQYLAEEK